jgi:hypothetical protein
LTTVPGGKPVIAVPGLTPRSPEITEGPVFVTVWPANTANEVAVPRPTELGAAEAGEMFANPSTRSAAPAAPITRVLSIQRRTEPTRLDDRDFGGVASAVARTRLDRVWK